MKVEVGMTVYLEPLNNASRRDASIKEARVVKVGRKYFYTTPDGLPDWDMRQFRLDNMLEERQGYASNWQAHLSLQELQDRREREALHHEIRMKFVSAYRPALTLDQLRRIAAIMEEA